MRIYKIILILGILLSITGFRASGQNPREIVVEARISNEQGQAIANAVVYGNEGNTVVYPNASGQFSISVVPNSTLLIEADGYESTSVKAVSGIEQVQLKAHDGSTLVNLAFRKKNSKDLYGAVSYVNPVDYLSTDYSLYTAGVNSRVNGLLYGNNIWGMGGALVLIDNIPSEYSDIQLVEVDQVTVLKGVNAVALYGSHAAKGVILITTKRGEVNKRSMSIRANTGIVQPKMLPSYLGSAEYMTLYNEARVNDGLDPLYDEATIQNYESGNAYRYPNIDYYSDEYLNDFTYATDLNAEFSGGNENARFYSIIGWSRNNSLLKVGEGNNENSNRLNVRGNIDMKLNNIISASVDISVILNDSRYGLGNYWGNAATFLPNKFAPLIPVSMINQDSLNAMLLANNSKNLIDGQYLLGGSNEYQTNPFADLYAGGYGKNISRVMQISNGIDVDLNQWMKGLTFNTRIYAAYYNSYNLSINNTYSVYQPLWSEVPGEDIIVGLTKIGNDSKPGVQNVNNTAQKRVLGYSAQFNYEKTIDEVHHYSGLLLANISSISQNGIFQNALNTNLGLQVGYNYDGRYYADFSSALINSTKLPAGNRLGFSPTLGLGWLISAEDFMADAGALDFLKLSVSAGILNTDLDISGHYLYDNIYARGSWFSWYDGTYNYQATTSQYGANSKLGYAKRNELNLVIDGSAYDKMLQFQASLFMTRMGGLPIRAFNQYPEFISDYVPYTNFNANTYSGVDASVQYNKQVGEVKLSIGLIANYTTSKASKRDELFEDDYQYRAGKPVDAIFGLENEGLYADDAAIAAHAVPAFGEVQPGDIQYTDQNNDGIINVKDEVMIGRWGAPLNGALNLTATYKAFTLFVQATGNVGGHGVMTNNYYWVDGDDKYSEIVRDRWTEATKNTATFPRLSSQSNNNNFRYSDFWLYSTNRLNLSKVQLTYALPKKMMQKSFIREMGIFVNASGLLTMSKNSEILDLNVGSAPQNKYYNAGINIKF